jgi:ABC-2 type transport system permease protein
MTTVLPRPAALAARPASFTRLTAVELHKTISTRSGVALTATAAVLPAGAVALMLALDAVPPNAPTMLALLGTLVAMLLLAVGILSTAGEWTHGTVQTTFLTVPGRDRVLATKYAAAALLGAALAAVVVATTYGLAAAFSDLSFAGAGAAAVAAVAAGAAMTAIGAGVGAAVANAPAALTGSYLVLLVGMTVLSGVRPAWAEAVDPLQAVFDGIQGDATGRPVAVLAGWLVATAVAGTTVTRRRQVT